jgi:hypothetical protein
LLVVCASLLTLCAAARAAVASNPKASIARVELRTALAERDADKRTVAVRTRRFKRCLRTHAHRPSRCRAGRRALRRARRRLARARRRTRRLSAEIARAGQGTVGGRSSSRHHTNPPPSTTTSGSQSTGSGSTSTGPFEMGVVAGSALTYELPLIEKTGARTARMEFGIGTPASQLAPILEEYARAGIRPLLLASFHGRLPSSAEAQNLASWAAEFGPGGSLWQGKSFPAGTAVSTIEFGNETSYEYQFSDNSPSAYASRAQTYALRLKEAYEAIKKVNASVGLLGQGDDGDNGPEWVKNMFAAVPNLGQMVAGWTVHPYGPGWEAKINRLISQTSAAGAPSSIPIYITEWGLATDNGRCLSDNYGFNPCMTYQEAATTLQSNLAAMRAKYGSRLASFYLYEARDEAATGTSTERESYFGALQIDEASKGAYTSTVQSLLAANP